MATVPIMFQTVLLLSLRIYLPTQKLNPLKTSTGICVYVKKCSELKTPRVLTAPGRTSEMLCWKELKIKEKPLGKETNPKLLFHLVGVEEWLQYLVIHRAWQIFSQKYVSTQTGKYNRKVGLWRFHSLNLVLAACVLLILYVWTQAAYQTHPNYYSNK